MNRQTANNWRPFLNIMQRVAVEVDIARTCLREPTHVRLGRKELYELKRDWLAYIVMADDEKTITHVGVGMPVTWLSAERVNETEWLEVV